MNLLGQDVPALLIAGNWEDVSGEGLSKISVPARVPAICAEPRWGELG